MNDKPIVEIWCDGAAEPSNPGPAAWGVVLIYGSVRKELSGYIGIASNQVAEVVAAIEGLKALKKRVMSRSTRIASIWWKAAMAIGTSALILRYGSSCARFREITMSNFTGLKAITVMPIMNGLINWQIWPLIGALN